VCRSHSRPAIYMRLQSITFALALASAVACGADKMAATYTADGFDFPVGKPDAEGYYKARGHLGEDWNGKAGGDTDLGDPVTSCANGVVVFAENFGHGWGNVVIIRHVYEEGGAKKYCDSLYGHLDQIQTKYGLHVKRGQQIGTIGTGGGRYPAHLHFEIRKELRLGMARHRFPRDDRSYWSPTDFINARRQLARSSPTAMVPYETFVAYKITTPADVTQEEEEAPAFFVPAGTKPAPGKDGKPKRPDGAKK
jgi:hypothetical protein